MNLNDLKRNKKLLKLLNKKLDKQVNEINMNIIIGFQDIFKIIYEKNDNK